jgi:hypothetical protein
MNKISLKLAASEACRLPLAGIFDHANVAGTAAKAAALTPARRVDVKFSANRK